MVDETLRGERSTHALRDQPLDHDDAFAAPDERFHAVTEDDWARWLRRLAVDIDMTPATRGCRGAARLAQADGVQPLVNPDGVDVFIVSPAECHPLTDSAPMPVARHNGAMRMRLRQIVMVAEDLAAAEAAIEEHLGVELCYRDPGVATFGLHNALFPIGEQLLEVVSPTQPGTTAGRQLDKRGGDSGYMVILEVDDLVALRERAASSGARIVFEAVADGIVGLHFHPADVGGAILSVDRTDTWGDWPWAGPEWRNHVVTDTVSEVLAVTIEANDPAAMAGRWAALLGVEVEHDQVIALPDGGELRFVPAGDRGEGVAGFTLRAARAGSVTICNCVFDLVADE